MTKTKHVDIELNEDLTSKCGQYRLKPADDPHNYDLHVRVGAKRWVILNSWVGGSMLGEPKPLTFVERELNSVLQDYPLDSTILACVKGWAFD